MPRNYLSKAERSLNQRRTALESILRDPTATPADRLKALDRLDRLDRKAPKPKPEETVSADVLEALREPPAPVILSRSGLERDMTAPQPVAAKLDASESVSGDYWLAPAALAPAGRDIPAAPSQPSASVSWESIFGRDAVLSEDFKNSVGEWHAQEEKEAAIKRRAAWEQEQERLKNSW